VLGIEGEGVTEDKNNRFALMSVGVPARVGGKVGEGAGTA
jgi:hypothetical protein